MIDISKPKIIGLIANANEGKSNFLYYLINSLKEKYNFNLCYFGLRCKIEGQEIFSLDELEIIKNSIIVIDEFINLFDLDDRHKRKQIENTLRLLYHNNNIVILSGLPENFKKFISGKINCFIYKQVTFEDFIRGSSAKKNILNYNGYEKASKILVLEKNEAIIYDEKHYKKLKIPYLEEFDTKKDNPKIFSLKK